jgi:hypothetical protein
VPDILIRRALTAAIQTVLPLNEGEANWRFRRCPYPRGLYTILVRTTGAAGDIAHSVLIGTTEVVQRGDTSMGGTDGVMPTPAGANATPAHQFIAEAGDEISLQIDKRLAAGTPSIMVWANVEPA